MGSRVTLSIITPSQRARERERERERERRGEERGAKVEVGGQDERQSSRAEVACISIYRLMSHILFWQSKVQKATKTTKKLWVEF